MSQVLEALDGAALLTWAHACVAELTARRREIDALNVFPIADADTGTNLLATMRAAVAAAQDAVAAGGVGLTSAGAGSVDAGLERAGAASGGEDTGVSVDVALTSAGAESVVAGVECGGAAAGGEGVGVGGSVVDGAERGGPAAVSQVAEMAGAGRMGADGDAAGRDTGTVARALARGATRGARGNSGIILSQVLRGLAEAVPVGNGPLTGREVRAALVGAASLARAGLSAPVDGTILTVLDQAASAADYAVPASGPGHVASASTAEPTSVDSAVHAPGPSTACDAASASGPGHVASASTAEPMGVGSAVRAASPSTEGASTDGSELLAVAVAASSAAAEALARTPTQLGVLRAAGVVDAGARGLLVLLDCLVATVGGTLPARPAYTRDSPHRASVGNASYDASLGGGRRTAIGSNDSVPRGADFDAAYPTSAAVPHFEVMYLISGIDATTADALRDRLAILGDSVVVVGDGTGTFSAHVHCRDAGAAIEAGIAVGHLSAIKIESFVATTPHEHNPGDHAGEPGGAHQTASASDLARRSATAGEFGTGPAHAGGPGRAPRDFVPTGDPGGAHQTVTASDLARRSATAGEFGTGPAHVGGPGRAPRDFVPTGDPGSAHQAATASEFGHRVESGGAPNEVAATGRSDRDGHAGNYSGAVGAQAAASSPAPAEHPRTPRGVLAVVAGTAAATLFESAGATTLRGDQPTFDSSALLTAIRSMPHREVLVLPNGALPAQELVAVGMAARDESRDVLLLPSASMVQGLAALAVHDQQRVAVDDVFAMSEAAATTRWGALRAASGRALTMVGTCEPGDGLGLVGHDVVVIDPDVLDAGRILLDRMLSLGGELVTLLMGADASAELGDVLTAHIEAGFPGVEVVVYSGGQQGDLCQIGVE
ncbi:hypothetical protein GCM10011591_13460 [Nocardia camponoti]|uniref:DhaL domain-containing protein n=1 Tax=Nocardia camponoti TaxID=1616106 RepID=A0A917QCD5_9NOCA|nr:hypothetical protein GCM10011591_13460 [Nocardia camponoti]